MGLCVWQVRRMEDDERWWNDPTVWPRRSVSEQWLTRRLMVGTRRFYGIRVLRVNHGEVMMNNDMIHESLWLFFLGAFHPFFKDCGCCMTLKFPSDHSSSMSGVKTIVHWGLVQKWPICLKKAKCNKNITMAFLRMTLLFVPSRLYFSTIPKHKTTETRHFARFLSVAHICLWSSLSSVFTNYLLQLSTSGTFDFKTSITP